MNDLPSDNLKALHDTRSHLLLETRILSFGVLAEDDHINSGMSGFDAGHRFDRHYVSVEICGVILIGVKQV